MGLGKESYQEFMSELDAVLMYLDEETKVVFRNKVGFVDTSILIECARNSYLLDKYGAEELIGRVEWMNSFEVRVIPDKYYPFSVRNYIDNTVGYPTEEELIEQVKLYGVPRLPLGNSTGTNDITYDDSYDKLVYRKIDTPEEYISGLSKLEKRALKCYLEMGYTDNLLALLNNYAD